MQLTQQYKKGLQEQVLAKEEQMAAARTKQHEEEKHTGIRTEKIIKKRTQGKKNKKIVHKALTVTLSSLLQRRARNLGARPAIILVRTSTTVPPLSPPLREQINQK